jgi:hypothetical protein
LVYKGRYGAGGQQRSDELGNEGITRVEKRRIGPGDRVEDVEDEEAFIIKEVGKLFEQQAEAGLALVVTRLSRLYNVLVIGRKQFRLWKVAIDHGWVFV